MKKSLIKIFKLIVLIIFYIPVLFTDFIILALSGIDYSCKLTDFYCLSKKPGDIIFLIILLLINFLFIRKIVQELRKIKNANAK